jgi:hypothetical protein
MICVCGANCDGYPHLNDECAGCDVIEARFNGPCILALMFVLFTVALWEKVTEIVAIVRMSRVKSGFL